MIAPSSNKAIAELPKRQSTSSLKSEAASEEMLAVVEKKDEVKLVETSIVIPATSDPKELAKHLLSTIDPKLVGVDFLGFLRPFFLF